MKFTADLIDSPWLVRAYEPGCIRVGETEWRQSILLIPGHPVQPWPVTDLDAMEPGLLQGILDHRPDLVLFGTGERQRFPRPARLAPLVEAGIGHEVMDTAAACRTFNILLGEERPLVAALIP